MTLRLILVRHGLSSFNKELRIQGRNDLSILTNEGKLQAIEAGKLLSELSINAIYSSPLQRAKETTKTILSQINSQLSPVYTDDLLEIDLEPWSGLTKNEVESKFPEAFLTWEKEPKELTLQHKDGSNYNPVKELLAQSDTFLQKLLELHPPESSETVLIVAHNAILKCILINLLGDPTQAFGKIQIDNASISVINIKSKETSPYDIQLECLNTTTHLGQPLPRQKSTRRILLIRHGETNWNQQGRFQGQIDIPLNSNGKNQALAACEFLECIHIDKAFSSSLIRPKETAEIIMSNRKNKNIELEEKLIEIGHGTWEGKLESEIKKEWPKLLENWKRSPETVQMPGGENIKEVWERSVKCWLKISNQIKANETALVVAHDAVNKTILCHLLGLTPANIWMIKQGNGGISVIDLPKDSNQPSVLACLNITSHLGGLVDQTAQGAL